MSSSAVDPEIYAKSGDISKHLEGVQKQYDTAEKREFYAQVMGDGTGNIHFGKWDNIDLDQDGAYGKAAEQMTDYMFQLATELLGQTEHLNYIDLGSGTGGAGVRLTANNPTVKATLLNLCPEQNAAATADAVKAGVADRVTVVTGTYDEPPEAATNGAPYDFAFSQDAFVHSFAKRNTYAKALQLVKPGGVFLFCDLMCGTGEGVSDEELHTFAQTNMVNDWLNPADNCQAAEAAGWTDVKFIDLTNDIKISFQLMGKKVEKMIAAGDHGIEDKLLETYKENLEKRVGQVDRGVFQWGVITAKKPTP